MKMKKNQKQSNTKSQSVKNCDKKDVRSCKSCSSHDVKSEEDKSFELDENNDHSFELR